MMINRMSLGVIAVVVASVVNAADTPELLCRDIHAIPERDLLLMSILRGADTLVLDGGKVCSSEGVEPGSINCGWEFTIENVGVLRPATHIDLRVVRIVKDHLTGSGTESMLIAFQCKDARVVSVFSKEFTCGVNFEPLSANGFALTAGYWLHQDPMCCPSLQKRIVYRWDEVGKAYVVSGESFLRHNPKTNSDDPVAQPAETVLPWNP
jgi:hypothetical protein